MAEWFKAVDLKSIDGNTSASSNLACRVLWPVSQELLDLLRPDYIQGLTFSGGDPLFVQNRLIVGYICERVRKEFGDTKDIWMWTGYEWDQIKDWDHLNYVDVLVDGPYIEAQRDISLPWAGSNNQRVIDVKRSLKKNEVVLWKEN